MEFSYLELDLTLVTDVSRAVIANTIANTVIGMTYVVINKPCVMCVYTRDGRRRWTPIGICNTIIDIYMEYIDLTIFSRTV